VGEPVEEPELLDAIRRSCCVSLVFPKGRRRLFALGFCTRFGFGLRDVTNTWDVRVALTRNAGIDIGLTVEESL